MNQILMRNIQCIAVLVLMTTYGFAADQQDAGSIDLGDGLSLYSVPANIAPVKKHAVVVHGFNVKPTIMEPAIKFLTDSGIPTILVALPGHRPGTTMNYKDWRASVKLGLEKAQTFADDGEVILLGHSLGGALASLEAVFGETKIATKMVLLAPANGLASLRKILKFEQMQPCTNSQFLNTAKPFIQMAQMFGMNPLAQAGTMICGNNAYSTGLTLVSFEALIAASEESRNEAFKKTLALKTLVVMDKRDGLIDHTEITSIFGNSEHAEVVILENASDPISAHTFQGGELLQTAMKEHILPFILQ
jgi:hypothetical protein